jgi:hypothetical protein
VPNGQRRNDVIGGLHRFLYYRCQISKLLQLLAAALASDLISSNHSLAIVIQWGGNANNILNCPPASPITLSTPLVAVFLVFVGGPTSPAPGFNPTCQLSPDPTHTLLPPSRCCEVVRRREEMRGRRSRSSDLRPRVHDQNFSMIGHADRSCSLTVMGCVGLRPIVIKCRMSV